MGQVPLSGSLLVKDNGPQFKTECKADGTPFSSVQEAHDTSPYRGIGHKRRVLNSTTNKIDVYEYSGATEAANALIGALKFSYVLGDTLGAGASSSGNEFSNIKINGTNGENAEMLFNYPAGSGLKELVIQSNNPGLNVLALQNTNTGPEAYSCLTFKDKTGYEKSAIGYGIATDTNIRPWRSVYWESWEGIDAPGFLVPTRFVQTRSNGQSVRRLEFNGYTSNGAYGDAIFYAPNSAPYPNEKELLRLGTNGIFKFNAPADPSAVTFAEIQMWNNTEFIGGFAGYSAQFNSGGQQAGYRGSSLGVVSQGAGGISFVTKTSTAPITFNVNGETFADEAMRITPEKKVAIGTPTAVEKLTVSYSDNTGANGISLTNTNNGAVSLAGITVNGWDGGSGGFAYLPANFQDANSANTVLFNSGAKNKLAFVANAAGIDAVPQEMYFKTVAQRTTHAIHILPVGSNDNVGIGVNAPVSILHIAGPMTVNQTTEPPDPTPGSFIFWMQSTTGTVKMKKNVGGTITSNTIF